MKWMYKDWWKILGIVVFLYVLIGGLAVPLKPGVTEMRGKTNLVTGDIQDYQVFGYNTNYLDAQNFAWLKVGNDYFLKAIDVKPSSQNLLDLTFEIPEGLTLDASLANPTLIVYNTKDGPSILPSAVSIVYKKSANNKVSSKWDSSFGMDLIIPAGIKFPYRSILNETIRNTFFHVAFWLAMTFLLLMATFYAFKNLLTKDPHYDRLSSSIIKVGILYGVIGTLTGAIWARFTWGTWWTSDVKLNMAMTSLLIYFAYLLLRSANNDFEKRAKFSSAYAIFAFCALIPLIFVIPRMTDSLHPGNGGNPALGGEDLDNTLRMFFYPAIIALILLGGWMSSLIYRYEKLKTIIYTKNNSIV